MAENIDGVKQHRHALDKRGKVRIPLAVMEENGLEVGSGLVDVIYGKNYGCIVIVPANVEIKSRDQVSRIKSIVNEGL